MGTFHKMGYSSFHVMWHLTISLVDLGDYKGKTNMANLFFLLHILYILYFQKI